MLLSFFLSLFTRIDEYAELSHAPISSVRSTNNFERTVVGNQRTLGIEIIRIQIPTRTTTAAAAVATTKPERKTQDEAVATAALPINP